MNLVLDKYDSYGVSVANERPRLASTYAMLCKLTCDDPFGREWHNNRGTLCLRAQAWGRDEEDREGRTETHLPAYSTQENPCNA